MHVVEKRFGMKYPEPKNKQSINLNNKTNMIPIMNAPMISVPKYG